MIKLWKNPDVLVVGGSAAGIVAAITGKRFYPDKEFVVMWYSKLSIPKRKEKL
ncbi:MAG: hypothetical protein SV775_04015 [Thermodesulfobacteriota bacterium]|nr:hypothetical protein [Thermodesulfobacteriota bacterium]